MPQCVNCATRLETIRQREGLFFRCSTCAGRAVTLPQIRRVAGDRFATHLIRQINRNQRFEDKRCPFCERPMRRFHSETPPLELDACKLCGVVWFDAQEFECVPEGAPQSIDELRDRATEAFAKHRLELLNEEIRREEMASGAPPDETWKTVPALFGFPVESDLDALSRRPWATWAVAFLIVVISGWGFFNLEPRIQTWGLIPAEFWRYGGFTLVSSFFLHGSVGHLVGNLYFFLIFADNVEDYLGHWRFLGLLLLATLVGDSLHAVADPRSAIPCIGASGGISGVIVFYALKFPHARLGFFWRLRWIHLPAWGALALWLLWQTFGVFQQLSGISNVSALAHLGGAAVGFFFWLKWRKQ